MKVAAINLPHSLTPRQAAHDSELVFGLVGPEGVVLACEVDQSNDRPFERAAANDGKRVHFRNRKTQVATPKQWRHLEAIGYRITRAPKLWSNPGRDANAAFHHDSRTVYVAIHAPNRRHGKPFWRLSVRKNGTYLARVARKVERWHAGGWNVVLGGDGNDTTVYPFHPDQETVAHAGLMWIIAVPAAGYRLSFDAEEFVTRANLGDHPVVVASNLTFCKETR